jgi:hypothetical protein
MLCESCRAGDPECNAWIACERQVESDSTSTPQSYVDGAHGDEVERFTTCSLVYEVGYDEFDPYVEPRRVLVCEVHP